MDDEFQLLAARLSNNDELKPEDRPRVKRMVYQLNLDNETTPRDQNDRWAVQQRMEAMIIYLISTYTDHVIAASRNMEWARDDERLTLPDKDPDTSRKYNREDREALIGQSSDVRDKQEQKDASDALLRDLKKLEATIIRRNEKVNDISVNVRRQEEVDERST